MSPHFDSVNTGELPTSECNQYGSDFFIASMHKSTLSTNNFGKNQFGKNTRSKLFLEFLGEYNGVRLKNFQRIEQKLENAFLAKFSILLTNS